MKKQLISLQRKYLVLNIFMLFFISNLLAQEAERPFIWVKQSERSQILEKIAQEPWATSLYTKFLNRADEDFNVYQKSPELFLKKLPFNWEAQKPTQIPPLKIIIRTGPQEKLSAPKKYIEYSLQVAIDCGVLYYLTNDEKYAQCGLDILHTFIETISQLPYPTESGNNGIIYPEDHLYESRVINAQIPIIYDFITPFIKKGGMPYDFVKNKKVLFNNAKAQKVFKNYVELVINQGMTGSNWSVLEAPSMVQNLLALDNVSDRKKYINVYLNEGSPRQDPLSTIASFYKNPGDVYPETSNYSNAVASYSTVLMTMLTKYDPSLNLIEKYPNIPLGLSRWEAMKYPNGELVRFGDAPRTGGTSYAYCEYAYYLGEITETPDYKKTFGYLIATAISEDTYQRDELNPRSFPSRVYFEPLQLLWYSENLKGEIIPQKQPRTDNLVHASVFLQRNESADENPENGLMCFVGGAAMVHGHATGMNMELYGKGQVLGVDNGNGNYKLDLHENYSRLFAAHNTVIVNGNSQSEGGWANLGQNPVELVSMEPMPLKEAVSPNFSFTQTSFLDDKGDKAEAEEQRTLALIRTSETTGYYVDVFRSKSKLPNQYHDYLYHNIGDALVFENKDLTLVPTPNRYMANANNKWVANRTYRHPGWHFFENVETSSQYNKEVRATFNTEKMDGKPIYMSLHIPGFDDREYTKVKAPLTFSAPKPYDTLATPTLVIRKNGEAWIAPFVVVYEPYNETPNNKSVQSVEKLMQDGIYKGLKIKSKTSNGLITQYIITQAEHELYENKENGIIFKGVFAIITLDRNEELTEMYIGNGEELHFKNNSIKKISGENFAAYLSFENSEPQLNSNGKCIAKLANGKQIIVE
ncbi:heparinase II/III domain-containing protein [Mariniflexile sp.]|uniref:heparinase II/III domain-containing protein n=2 Tax=Mariniflexile sp. TaxID=1979402 RepID=UPI004047518A